jgi:hypothetical protein
LAKPNYSFEKRQRELAKKRKKEDKAAKKASGGGDELNPNEAAMAMTGGPQGEPEAANGAQPATPSTGGNA